jgi:hypothetical protein
MEKRKYSPPRLVEYGSITRLTLGSGGSKPDLQVPNFNLINNNCDASAPAFACLVS